MNFPANKIGIKHLLGGGTKERWALRLDSDGLENGLSDLAGTGGAKENGNQPPDLNNDGSDITHGRRNNSRSWVRARNQSSRRGVDDDFDAPWLALADVGSTVRLDVALDEEGDRLAEHESWQSQRPKRRRNIAGRRSPRTSTHTLVRPTCSSSTFEKQVLLRPAKMDLPSGPLTLCKAAGPWQTAATGFPLAKNFSASSMLTGSTARSCLFR